MSRQKEAYFTVEAALLLPFVTGIILMVIYLWFFQYNRCMLEFDTGMLALCGNVSGIEDKEALMERLRKEEAQIYTEKYIAWNQDSVKIRLEKDRIRVERRGSIEFPFTGLNFWSDKNFWEAKAVVENHMLSPAFFVRACRKIKGGE